MTPITVVVTDPTLDVAQLQKLADAKIGPQAVLITDGPVVSQNLMAALAASLTQMVEPEDLDEPLWIRLNQQPSSPWNKKPRR